MNKKIAFFDFDGTITTKDTLLEFLKFSKGRFSFYAGMLMNAPFIAAFKLKIITNQQAKEKLLSWFWKDTTLEEFEGYCQSFAGTILPRLLRPRALQEIKRLQQEGYTIVVVSASPENWIRPWTKTMDIHLLASELEVKQGRLTGKICGKNCNGEEKVRRIMEKYALQDYEVIAAYGDTPGDRPMLKLAHAPYYRHFHK